MKYRAWHTGIKQYVSDFYINPNGEPGYIGGSEGEFEIKEFLILEENTGFTDANDKEIFIGDILYEKGMNYEDTFLTVFENGAFGVLNKKEESSFISFWCNEYSEISRHIPLGIVEIIGNIRINPELLIRR